VTARDALAGQGLRDAQAVAQGKPSKLGAKADRRPMGNNPGQWVPGSNPVYVRTPTRLGKTIRLFVRGKREHTWVENKNGETISQDMVISRRTREISTENSTRLAPVGKSKRRAAQ
jgi:hypothetical protein